MMRRVYLAAPVRPIEGETKEGNLALAKEFYRALAEIYTETLILAPWILNCECFPEEPKYIEIGMRRNFETIKLCNELWLCGPRVSTGMRLEAEFFIDHFASLPPVMSVLCKPDIYRIKEIPPPHMTPAFERWTP